MPGFVKLPKVVTLGPNTEIRVKRGASAVLSYIGPDKTQLIYEGKTYTIALHIDKVESALV
jgi:hypothetical protein